MWQAMCTIMLALLSTAYCACADVSLHAGTNGGEDKDDAPEAAAPAQPSPDPAAAAGSSGAAIDNSFLEALPTGLRDEVMAAPADAEAPGGSAGPVEGTTGRQPRSPIGCNFLQLCVCVCASWKVLG